MHICTDRGESAARTLTSFPAMHDALDRHMHRNLGAAVIKHTHRHLGSAVNRHTHRHLAAALDRHIHRHMHRYMHKHMHRHLKGQPYSVSMCMQMLGLAVESKP